MSLRDKYLDASVDVAVAADLMFTAEKKNHIYALRVLKKCVEAWNIARKAYYGK